MNSIIQMDSEINQAYAGFGFSISTIEIVLNSQLVRHGLTVGKLNTWRLQTQNHSQNTDCDCWWCFSKF